jgi:hypothetical protein
MPTERPATSVSVSTSSYAREVSPAMVPEPRRFSTPMSCSEPSLAPTMSTRRHCTSPVSGTTVRTQRTASTAESAA